jgi:hypothetical protein
MLGNVGQTHAPLRQQPELRWQKQDWDNAGVVQNAPKAIARIGIVGATRGGEVARGSSAKHGQKPRRKDIRQNLAHEASFG